MKENRIRFTALDVFRGMTICFMIIVNSPGAVPYWPLDHAAWHGFTPTDLVFPSFLFAVGNALSFSEKKFSQQSTQAVVLHILKRSLLIFLLGYLMYWFPFFKVSDQGAIQPFPISSTRIFGVLQRIGICYFFTALAAYFLKRRYLIPLSAILLLLYWFLLVHFGSDDPFSVQGNAILKLDLWLFGPSHLYVDRGILFDPEGLLSTLPALVNTMAGYLVGKYFQEKGTSLTALRPLLYYGVLGVLAALLWDTVFPINKKIWSSSFSLLTISLDLLLLPLLVLISQAKNGEPKRWTAFFTIFGKNPLFVYLLSELLLTILHLFPIGSVSLFDRINSGFLQEIVPGKAGSLLFSLAYMLLCWSVGWMLDKKKIYIKV